LCGLKTLNNKDSICYEEVAQKKLTGISESSIFSCYFHHDREDMCPALDMRLMTGQVVRFLLISELTKRVILTATLLSDFTLVLGPTVVKKMKLFL